MTPLATRLPLTVIGGFLGAGKTTLLNHWLAHAGAGRLAVLVNDFGALNIDAGLITANTGETIALSNGCVCCQIGDDLSAALIRVLEQAGRFDGVVIEASGVSDPWRIAQLGRADPGLSLDGVVVLVDAVAAGAQARDPLLTDTLERQLRAADLVVINKCDAATETELADLRHWITTVAGVVPRFETTQAVVPLALMSGLAMPAPPARSVHLRPGAAHTHTHDHTHDHDHDHDHSGSTPDHGAVFDTWSCRPAHRFDEAALRAWLKQPVPGLLRLKGVVCLEARPGETAPWCEIQFAGRHGALRRTQAPQDGAALVAIGLRGHLPVDALRHCFEPQGATPPNRRPADATHSGT